MARRTTLGLTGVPRSAPLISSGAAEDLPPRPPGPKLTHLGLLGVARSRRRAFSHKGGGEFHPRPDIDLTALSPLAVPGRRRRFSAKALVPIVMARVSVSFVPSATLRYSPRHTVPTDVVVGVRPMGATITYAHVTKVSGSTAVRIAVTAQMRFRRQGVEHEFQGNTGFEITPFGNVTYRTWKRSTGSMQVKVEPRAALTFTPAPVRNYRVRGSARVTTAPSATLMFSAGGIVYGVQGSSLWTVRPSGRVLVTRQTMYAVRGRVTVSLTPRGSAEKGLGPPVEYRFSGHTTVSLIPRGSMGVQEGLFEQHAVFGHVQWELRPGAVLRYTPAPTIPALGPGKRRRLIRIFR